MHLAIIPDGNRRWARAKKIHPWKGHEQAIQNFRSITDFCRKDPRIDILTVWCFSTENWKRDPKEIAELFRMLEDYLRKERQGFIKEHTRFVHSGRRDRIPKTLSTLIAEVEQETLDQTEFILHFAVDYGGKDEIVRAIRKIKKTETITEKNFQTYLDHPSLPDIDLVIRTSGEQRTSNFFLWQSTYAEWIFSEKFFPDFSVTDLTAALDTYAERQRRYGS
ncbi:di-trans,poly-cis-decaprenylcistransferase [Candidatus Peregrinibacteria bacterium]|nr:di-trans,poly-cis-decaprenylcistransferase [Candidatus Peregrinibacteria bacterium]